LDKIGVRGDGAPLEVMSVKSLESAMEATLEAEDAKAAGLSVRKLALEDEETLAYSLRDPDLSLAHEFEWEEDVRVRGSKLVDMATGVCAPDLSA
jgi:hypothetical protein